MPENILRGTQQLSLTLTMLTPLVPQVQQVVTVARSTCGSTPISLPGALHLAIVSHCGMKEPQHACLCIFWNVSRPTTQSKHDTNRHFRDMFVLYDIHGLLFHMSLYRSFKSGCVCVCFSCWRWCQSYSNRAWVFWCWGGNTCYGPPDHGRDTTWILSSRKLIASSLKTCEHIIMKSYLITLWISHEVMINSLLIYLKMFTQTNAAARGCHTKWVNRIWIHMLHPAHSYCLASVYI